MKEIQLQHALWLQREFPGQPVHIPAAGMVEEAGELLHAVLKLEQRARWGDDPRYTEESLREKLVDAVGDCGIYVCSYCNAAGLDFDEVLRRAPRQSYAVFDMCVELCRVACTHISSGYNRSHLHTYVALLRCIAESVDVQLEAAVRKTWATVQLRQRVPETYVV